MKRFLKTINFEKNLYKIVPYAFLDAYLVGDRLLDGKIYFKLWIDLSENLQAQFHATTEYQKDYLKKFNESYWCQEACKFALKQDLFNEDPNNEESDDIVLYDFSKHYTEQHANFENTPIILNQDDYPNFTSFFNNP